MTAKDVAELQRCTAAGGVALFPSDTVYGLATAPESVVGVERLYRIKGRPAARPAAVMFFDLATAFAELAELGERTREALRRLLPGPVTVVLANPAQRFPLACATTPDRIGLRVPRLSRSSSAHAVMSIPVLQSSANRSGSGDVRRLDDVDPAIRSAVDLEIDGGELPGTPSTLIDLSTFESSGEHEILRPGALLGSEVAAALLDR